MSVIVREPTGHNRLLVKVTAIFYLYDSFVIRELAIVELVIINYFCSVFWWFKDENVYANIFGLFYFSFRKLRVESILREIWSNCD